MKALDVVGLSWLTHSFNIVWRSGIGPLNWQTEVVPGWFMGQPVYMSFVDLEEA